MTVKYETEFMLPWPPTVNHYYGHRAAGKRVFKYIKPKGKEYINEVIEGLKPLLKGFQEGINKDDRLAVSLTFYPPDRRKRDVDNLCKATLDAMQHARVYHDDSQIDAMVLVIHREDVREGGLVRAQIRVI